MPPHLVQSSSSSEGKPGFIKQFLGVFRYSRRALELVWSTSRWLTVALALLTLIAGVLPAAIAYVGKLIVDAVVLAAQTGREEDMIQALVYVGVEALVVAALAATQQGLSVCQALLRALLGHRVNVMILEKALTLSLEQFEDSEFYDKLTRARREASRRPLSLVNRTFGLIQNVLSLVTYGGLLLSFSGWAVLVLLGAALPAFFAETYFSGEAFRLFKWRAPESRQQIYLESVMAREDYAKEVHLYGMGPMLLERYRGIFDKLYDEDRDLTLRRARWSFALGLVSRLAFYGAYAWIAFSTVMKKITLGDMTMYLLVFKQGQSAFSAILTSVSGMYEDNLYLSNLYEFLEQETLKGSGTATAGPKPGDGIRFEEVSFTYPGSDTPALDGISLHLSPGERLALVGQNGSGKTTLIKLLTRLYTPGSGRITLDGLDLQEWDERALRARVGVIFQDFARYQFLVGENIGVGDVENLKDEARQENAADRGMAAPFIEELSDRYETQLGRWFKGGRELSGGQWQKIALSRLFMRDSANILVLDEPTSAMDAEAEVQIFDRIREMTDQQMAILISHRFSTVRMADRIVVMERGVITEHGTHEALMEQDGRYARLFSLQAAGYL